MSYRTYRTRKTRTYHAQSAADKSAENVRLRTIVLLGVLMGAWCLIGHLNPLWSAL